MHHPLRRSAAWLSLVAALALLIGALPIGPALTPPAWSQALPLTEINQIQGAAHSSPLAGQVVRTSGIVTALRPSGGRGFYLQDPTPDSNDATSEAIFVFTSVAPTVQMGDAVEVTGTVSEFRPGGSSSANLSTTQIGSPTIVVNSSGNPLPAPTVIGAGGRVPPTEVISDDAAGGSVENAGTAFDPASDGVDFYESLEAMRVQVNDAVAVGPTSGFGEIPILADDGEGASLRTPRGGLSGQQGGGE